MHFEILTEDQSSKLAIDIILEKLIGEPHTFRVISYKGLGHIPKNLHANSDAKKRILLNRLPSLLKGYGKTYSKWNSYKALIILVCDLDDRCLVDFKNELTNILNSCNPKPEAKFCFAIEESESWLLGDKDAILTAYPKAKESTMSTYENDSICGTWELLADFIYPGGSASMKKKSWHERGKIKCEWASRISPHMDVEKNDSPSFNYFRSTILDTIEK